jgi:hypothetical protein
MWGARGPFLPVAAMAVAVVMPVVFCAKATELFGEGKMKIANKASRQSSAQLLAFDDGGMNITDKAYGHLSA